MERSRAVAIFTKPARPGRVKTRLVGELTAGQAAELHAAFLEDVRSSLGQGAYDLHLAWALDEGEGVPEGEGGFRQVGEDLGDRLCRGLERLARSHARVAAVGSDHPELGHEAPEQAFQELDAGADLVLGPADDGGYYLIAVRSDRLDRRLFDGIAWSTGAVLEQTLERARSLGLTTRLLEPAHDIDTAADLAGLCVRLERRPGACPATRRLLATWGRLGAPRVDAPEAGGWRVADEPAMEALGAELAARVVPDRTLLLVGDLGAGKTVLVRGLGVAMGIPRQEIQSPTYTIVREHASGAARLVHVDIYRLDGPEIEAMGLEEILAGPGVKAVEWADRLPFPAPRGALRLRIEREPGGTRRVREEAPAGEADPVTSR